MGYDFLFLKLKSYGTFLKIGGVAEKLKVIE